MKKVFQFAAIALVAVMVSCSGGNGPEGSAKGYLDALMAEDFEKAKEFSTEDTKGMLDFMKSLSSMGGEKKEATKKEYKDLKCTVDAGDSTAVCNYKVEDKDEKINLKKAGDKWMVHMPKEGAPAGGMEGGMMDAGAEMPSDTNAAPAATEAPAAEMK
jgi:hypothetical protein